MNDNISNQIELDTGSSLFTLKSEPTRAGAPMFTVYATGISVRSQLLHLPRVLDNFTEAALAALGIDEDEAACDRIGGEIHAFVTTTLNLVS